MSVRRTELVARQRLERRNLRETQRERADRQAKALRDRLPTGWRAAWAKASGRYDRLLRDNAVQAQRLLESDRAERQQLVLRQLEERRVLRPALQQLGLHREINNDAQRRATGRKLARLTPGGILPQVDPRQPLLLADAKETLTAEALLLRPARIFDVLTRHDETFTRVHIERAVAHYIATPQEYRAVLDEVLRSDELVRIAEGIHERFTTATLRNARASVERQTAMLAEEKKHFVGRHVVDAAIAEQSRTMQAAVGASLSPEQGKAVAHIARAERLGAWWWAMPGPARAGCWGRPGRRGRQPGTGCVGAALSGIAAEGLEAGSGIRSRTLASLRACVGAGARAAAAGRRPGDRRGRDGGHAADGARVLRQAQWRSAPRWCWWAIRSSCSRSLPVRRSRS